MEEVERKTTGSNRRYILYEDERGLFFELTQRPIGADDDYGSILDTEDSDYEVRMINGNEAIFNEKGENCSILWTESNIVYRLRGNIEISDLQEIAEKIKILEN